MLRQSLHRWIAPNGGCWTVIGQPSGARPIRLARFRRVLSVMGFGGNGITFSMIAAQIVSAQLSGQPDPDAAIFRFR